MAGQRRFRDIDETDLDTLPRKSLEQGSTDALYDLLIVDADAEDGQPLFITQASLIGFLSLK